jgi:hypothetical protein
MNETSDGTPVSSSSWQAIAAAFPPVVQDARFSLYYNSGVPIASSQSGTGTTGTVGNGTSPINIAIRNDNNSPLPAAIGHVAVFPTKLVDAQVSRLMSAAHNEGRA